MKERWDLLYQQIHPLPGIQRNYELVPIFLRIILENTLMSWGWNQCLCHQQGGHVQFFCGFSGVLFPQQVAFIQVRCSCRFSIREDTVGLRCCEESVLLGTEPRRWVREYLGCLFPLGSQWWSWLSVFGCRCVSLVAVAVWVDLRICQEVWGCRRAAHSESGSVGLGCFHEGSTAPAGVGHVTGVMLNICIIRSCSHLRAIQFNC